MGGAVQCSLGLAQTPGHFATLERTGGQDGAAALGGVQSWVMESGSCLWPWGCNSGRGCFPEAHTWTLGRCASSVWGLYWDTCIVRYNSHNHSHSVFPVRKLHLPDHPGKGQGQLVRVTHKQLLQHNLAEGGVGWPETCTAWQTAFGRRPGLELPALNSLVLVVAKVPSHVGAYCSAGCFVCSFIL